MFTDLLNLPIDSDRASRTDQILSLAGMTWDDYEKLTKEYLGYRISYLNGVITLVSPSKSHERIAEIINGLIKTYCRKYNLAYFPMGSTTLKNPPLAGKEPDHSFAFETDKSIPDLAVEVTYTSGSVTDLEKYKYLRVKEVWFWSNNEITFYRLVDDKYQEIEESICLPKLSSNFLITFINRGLTETPLTIEADFYRQLDF
ncbi:MAG: Uma2 family endonuclease [Pleurocapsa sp. MO_226.B13]|nr:Uma2 family endonuclease [Pleurocapsa sp. MO_226.B13]